MTTIKRVCKVLTPTVTQPHYLKRGNFSVCYELAERLVDFFEDIETGSKIEKMDKKKRILTSPNSMCRSALSKRKTL